MENGKQKEPDFIIYLNDDETKKNLFCTILDISESWVKVKLNSGKIIIIPANRVLKIKRNDGDPQ